MTMSDQISSETERQTTPKDDFEASAFELVSFTLCPYVQRALIVLTEKDIPHKRTYISLADKPDWFKKISPLGKVPLLKSNRGVLFESQVISEYLDEITEPSIHPADSFDKAHHRSWIEFGSSILAAIAGFYSAKDHVSFQEKRDILVAKFQLLEQQLTDTAFFASDEFQLIDAVYGPIFRYFDVLENHLDFDWFATTPRVSRYRHNLKNRPSVIQAVPSDYHERLVDFLLNRQSYLSGLLQKQAA